MEQGGLAGAGRSHDGDEFAGVDFQRHAAQRRYRPMTLLVDFRDLDYFHHGDALPAASGSRMQFLVLDPVRLLRVDAETLLPLRLVHLVIALAPDRLAVSLEGEDVRG